MISGLGTCHALVLLLASARPSYLMFAFLQSARSLIPSFFHHRTMYTFAGLCELTTSEQWLAFACEKETLPLTPGRLCSLATLTTMHVEDVCKDPSSLTRTKIVQMACQQQRPDKIQLMKCQFSW